MLLPPDAENIEGRYMNRSLKNLGETIQSLLGSKKDLTFTWVESVRLIIEDLSSATNSPDFPSTYLKTVQLSDKDNCDLEASVLKLEEELAALKIHFRGLETKRKETLNKILDLKGSIRVFCRVKPFLISDKKVCPGHLLVLDSNKLVVKSTGGKPREYNFDKVFLPGASQDEIFAEVEPIIRSALDGHNVCIFAYGQTGTGKTFTMEGTPDCPGIVPHAIQELFHHASVDRTVSFTFSFSMLEVYMGNLRDLLAPRTTRSTDHKPTCLSIQMDPKGAVEIDNLREVIITNISQAIKLYGRGSRERSTAWTNANEASSRSHCLIRISINCVGASETYKYTSKLWMVDLGGSERLLKTQATGQTMEEGKAINMSLSALGDVISALQKKQAHVPYRNSKLTQILRDSVGNHSKMLMLVHISPKEDDICETNCSLGFATRVRGVHLEQEASPEAKVQKAAAMEKLMQQMKCLEDDCQSARNNVQTIEFLLREKKEYLAKANPSVWHQETLQYPASQETQIQNIKLGNVAQGSVGLPRYMNSTACSRVRGMLSEADIKSSSSTKTRAHLNRRRKSLLGSVNSSVIYPEMEQSLSDSESNKSNNSVLRKSSTFNRKNLYGIYSKKCDTDDSQCFSWCNTSKDSEMHDKKNMNRISFDEFQCHAECNRTRHIGIVENITVNDTDIKPISVDESECLSYCYTPKDGEMSNRSKVNGTYSKCIIDKGGCFLECHMPENGLLCSSMPRCKRVIAFHASPKIADNNLFLSNNLIEKAELLKDKNNIERQLFAYDKELDESPHEKQISEQSIPVLALAAEPMKRKTATTTSILEMEKTATTMARKSTTELYFSKVKNTYALWLGACLGVGLVNLGLGDDFFNGLVI